MTASLRVNMADGRTERFALEHPDDRARWRSLCGDPSEIRGIAFVVDHHQYVIPTPRKFSSLRFDAALVRHRDGSGDIVAFKISIYADDVRAELTVYRGNRPRMARFTLERSGRPVYIPNLDG